MLTAPHNSDENNGTDGQGIPHILRDPKVRYHSCGKYTTGLNFSVLIISTGTYNCIIFISNLEV